jgi:hypothetical protein
MGNSYAARINDANIVEEVLVVPFVGSDSELMKLLSGWKLDGQWILTYRDGSKRSHYAGVGYFYDAERDEFVPPEHVLVDGEWSAPMLEDVIDPEAVV